VTRYILACLHFPSFKRFFPMSQRSPHKYRKRGANISEVSSKHRFLPLCFKKMPLYFYSDHQSYFPAGLLIFDMSIIVRFLCMKNAKYIKKVRGKAIPMTGFEGPYGCETSRLPHFLGNRITDGCEVVSLTRRPHFTPQEDSWYSFLLEA
jgi:hypothetical protein